MIFIKDGKVISFGADGVKISNLYMWALSTKMDDLDRYLYRLHQARTTDDKIHYYNLACEAVEDFKGQYLFTMAKYGNHTK